MARRPTLSAAWTACVFCAKALGLKLVQENLSTHWDELKVQLYSSYTDHVMDNYTLRHPDPASMMPMAMASDVDHHARGGSVSGTWRWDDVIQLDAGIDGSTGIHDSRSGGPAGSMLGAYLDMPRTRDARMQTVGAFGELRWTWSPRQRLITGARLDHASTRGYGLTTGSTGTAMSAMNPGSMGSMPAAVATASATRSSTLPAGFARYERDLSGAPATFYVGLGRVERFPDYWELLGRHADTSLDSFRSLAPERTTQLDIGLQYHASRLKAWVSGYAGVVDDFILIHYPATPMDKASATNVQARIAGGEAGLSYAFTARWKGDATLATAWGSNRTEQRPLPQMPPLEMRLGLTYDHHDWSVAGLWRLVTAQHRVAVGEGNIVGQDLGRSSGFGVLSINGGYRFGKTVTLTAGIDNLLDKTYAEHINAAPPALAGYFGTVRINEPGRTGWLKLGIKF